MSENFIIITPHNYMQVLPAALWELYLKVRAELREKNEVRNIYFCNDYKIISELK